MAAAEFDLLAGWTSLTGSSEGSHLLWTDLINRWSEPHRRHHGLAHLVAVLSLVDGPTSSDAVRLAAWYHDAVYDPTRFDNEECSAELAAATLPTVGVDRATVAEVSRLVLVTRTHQYDAADTDAALLCDADLSILAGPASAYVGYANAIRAEYAHVPDPEFRAGRTKVLTELLGRKRLFGTAAFAALESAARDNMQAELALLRS